MIDPDTKDWTWVLKRACPECRFDAGSCDRSVVDQLVRENAEAWRGLHLAGGIRAGRPNAATWSSLEYTCHVRDVYRRYDERIALMMTNDNPLFPNWDQDISAVEDRYDEQHPARVVDELVAAAEVLSVRLERVNGADWDRPGRRSDGASFTVASIAKYMIHDPIHHLWDVTK